MKVRAKKHLGQHFLTDKRIAERIVNALPESEHAIIEIGPGMGVLTDFLLSKISVPFYALDLDTESIQFLRNKYPDHQTKFLEADFLIQDLDLLHQGKANIIGNFPYNISSQIMFKVLENRNKIDFVVGMFQKEVAKRIAEKPGSKEYGILSVLLQAYYKIDYLFSVSPGVFNPPPKVNSGVIRLSRNNTKSLACNEDLFFKVVKTCFNQRRKTIRNSIQSLLKEGTNTANELFDKRPEQLSVEEFIRLTEYVDHL